MEATSQTLTKLSDISRHRLNVDEFNDAKDVDGEEEEYDTEAWEMLTKCFREVQSVLDRNRTLIQQVNKNHQSMLPDNLVKNVALIRDINHNISKISRLYSDLSVNICNIVRQRRALDLLESKNRNGKAERR
ncbi:protein EARLY FLOWERING 4-like [Nicotiana tomentosiformis]|uniref:Protein EARLY FLOWERING 4-like n=1 Tax=Nicotiana tabacum TaxID=4097 RepID=A0A1S4DR23_TOBAC|nr:PREDICTED: protein EARLY FLOWERING 4-like [Nicotiana tabacum]XP_018621876.1 protein EARLY FLOWERING 4-like [Nicotiana tomentosiformis]